jgi:hypothetical protein
LDNSKGENSPLEGVKQRHKVKLRKEEEPEEGSSPVAIFFSEKRGRNGSFSHEKWKEVGEVAKQQTVPEAAC